MENMGENAALGLPSDVIVRRTVGMKKDEYLLNNKRADLNDVINLFETIGFSRCNPYNIVLQGQVEQLTAMSAAERLELVKDIAGASLYDDKKKESMKLLAETEVKMEKVSEVISSLEDRISSLGAEKEELMEYQMADKRRRGLEHRARDLEMESVEIKLNRVEEERLSNSDRSSKVYGEIQQLESAIESSEHDLRDAQKNRDMAESEFKEASAELTHLKTQLQRLNLALDELKESDGTMREESRHLKEEIAKKSAEIESKQSSIAKALQAYQSALDREKALKKEVDEVDRRMKELQSKQGRTRFATKKQRDEALSEEIRRVTESIEGRRKQSEAIEASISELQQEVESLEMRSKEKATRHEHLAKTVKDCTEEFNMAKGERDTWADSRKRAWQTQKSNEEDLFAKRAQLAHFEKALHSTLPRDLVMGLEAVAAMEWPKTNVVYGPLIDLVQVDPTYFSAVEAIAGTSLFHIVVDTDETASLVLKHLQSRLLGRVTCIPLNKVLARDYVGELSADITQKGYEAEPMTRVVLPSNLIYQPAINQVFGKALVCANLDLASDLSRVYRCTCVTLDGNQVNSKGAMTGGFLDEKNNRIRSSIAIRELKSSISSLEVAIKSATADSSKLDERITDSIKRMAEAERRRATAVYESEAFSETMRSVHRDLLAAREALAKRRQALEENESAIEALQKSVSHLTSERSSPMTSKLTDAEALELTQLTANLPALEASLTSAIEDRTAAEFIKTSREAEVSQKLQPELDDLEASLASMNVRSAMGVASASTSSAATTTTTAVSAATTASSSSKGLSSMVVDTDPATLVVGPTSAADFSQMVVGDQRTISDDIQSKTALMEELQQNIRQLEITWTDLKNTCREHLKLITEKKAQLNELLKIAQECSATSEKLFTELSSLQAKKEDLSRRLREIGLLPGSSTTTTTNAAAAAAAAGGVIGGGAVGEFAGLTLEQCREELQREKQKLSKFDHVNKKALDQFLSFSEEKDKFSARKEQMEKERDAIRALIHQLDTQKDDIIQRTFKAVAQQFTKVFATVCPTGEATLVMKVRSTDGEDEFVGIDLRVNFDTSRREGTKEGPAIRSFSGGQRTVISLSLIFAIQACDRAPFYIFDEIDPALDDRYRDAIATMVKESSKLGYQFIIVTHRPEMVVHADKNFIVSFSNRTSEITSSDTDSALEVVALAKQEDEEEASKQAAATKKRPPPLSTTAAPLTSPKKSSRAKAASYTAATAAADDEDDEDELRVTFRKPSNVDDEANPLLGQEPDPLVEPRQSRPKRSRG